jgi:hypothetical protein
METLESTMKTFCLCSLFLGQDFNFQNKDTPYRSVDVRIGNISLRCQE